MAQGPRDLLRYLVPKRSFQFNQESRFSLNHRTPPWPAGQLTRHSGRWASWGRLKSHQHYCPEMAGSSCQEVLRPPRVRFLRWHCYQDSTPTEIRSALGQFHSLVSFTLARSKSATPTIWLRDLLERNPDSASVVTHHFPIFLVNKRYNTRQSPGYLIRWKVFGNPGHLPEVPLKD